MAYAIDDYRFRSFRPAWLTNLVKFPTLYRAVDEQLRSRIAEGRTATPTAAVIDSQSVRAAETVWRSSRGWDAAKKVNGRQRHLAVDTMGLLICVLVTAANIQDRDGARPLLTRLATVSHRIRLVWADAGYAGALSDWARDTVNVAVQIVKRTERHRFVVLPRRWVVERILAWITRLADAPATTKDCPHTTKPWSAGP